MSDQPGGGSTRTVLIAIAVNAVVAIAKGVGGAISGSGALLSEAAHSVADTLNEGFLLIALRRGDRLADEEHPFGYGKERFFWSLLAAVGIFVAGAMFSFFEGYRTLSEAASGETSYLVPYVVLAVAFVAEGVSLARAVRQLRAEARRAQQSLADYIAASDDPTVKTVATEDSAALIGLLIAFCGILLAELTGNQVWQAVASFLIGALLVVVAIGLGRDSMGLLIGESADPRMRRRLVDALCAYEQVDGVIDLLTMRMGSRRLLVAVRLDFATSMSSDQIEALSTRIDEDLHARFPNVDQVFLDATARPKRHDGGARR